MSIIARSCWLPIILVMVAPTMAQHHHHSGSFASYSGHGHVVTGGYIPGGGGYIAGGGPGGGGHSFRGYGLGAVGGGYGFYGYGLPYAGLGYYPPPVVMAFPVPVGQGGGGLMLPMPPQGVVAPNPPAAPRRTNPARAKELVEIGDRSFRAGNTKRAEEKFLLAAKADPTAPAPHVHLAQVSLVRGDFAAAADHLRDAVTVANDPGWLFNAPDIQAIFAEPGDFAKHLARLESHLQANPNDRDAWFVLGAESYLSGRSKQASDVFQRLTDRRADEALSAFMDASKTKMPAAAN
jgi:tetratricopeptide (TPR) repeat protein